MTTCPDCGRTPTPAHNAAITDAIEFDSRSWWAMHDHTELGTSHTHHDITAALPLYDDEPADYGIDPEAVRCRRDDPSITTIPICRVSLYVINGLTPTRAFTHMDGHSGELGHLATAFVLGTAPVSARSDEPLTVAAVHTFTICGCWHSTELPSWILLRMLQSLAAHADIFLANAEHLGIITAPTSVGQEVSGILGQRNWTTAGHGVIASANIEATSMELE